MKRFSSHWLVIPTRSITTIHLPVFCHLQMYLRRQCAFVCGWIGQNYWNRASSNHFNFLFSISIPGFIPMIRSSNFFLSLAERQNAIFFLPFFIVCVGFDVLFYSFFSCCFILESVSESSRLPHKMWDSMQFR